MNLVEASNVFPSSLLLSLPAELRLCIYEFAFIPTHYRGPELPDPSDKASLRLSLLLTCRQIKAEAWAVAYSRTSFHISNLVEPLLDRIFLLREPLRVNLRYVTITLNLSIAPKILNCMDPRLMELPLEQLTISISKLRAHPQESAIISSTVEPASIEDVRAYSYIPASSLRFEIQMKNLKSAIWRGLTEPSNVKQITLLHDGCCYGNKFLRLHMMLCILKNSEEKLAKRWDISLDQARHAIDIVAASTDCGVAVTSANDTFHEVA
ncbi:uncharacterized protein BDZ99DRAFT_457599 [Mytilinidion resinicola]|uniref:F-box domain-containing protein n=1 Tax=Mytilinidion resinicola TaxID=574789 RepID=A0A6A6Z5Y7_9PEZI|nr:uncharacterized protein BDZ99DRAFT_457599 [Mytilinidion resinicola]KAF2815625.1 hypothetical protein BDZ99DRAFT_457599 [Mytilinidion resinicola]